MSGWVSVLDNIKVLTKIAKYHVVLKLLQSKDTCILFVLRSRKKKKTYLSGFA